MDYFFAFPFKINNGVCTYLMFIHLLRDEVFSSTDVYVEGIAWGNPDFLYRLHKFFLNLFNTRQYSTINFKNVPIRFKRFSINCMSWFGSFLDQTEILEEYEKVLVNTAKEKVKKVYDIVSSFGNFRN